MWNCPECGCQNITPDVEACPQCFTPRVQGQAEEIVAKPKASRRSSASSGTGTQGQSEGESGSDG